MIEYGIRQRTDSSFGLFLSQGTAEESSWLPTHPKPSIVRDTTQFNTMKINKNATGYFRYECT